MALLLWKTLLRTFVNHHQNNWDNLLPLCQFAINNARQSSTDHTPFFLNHGYDPLTLSSLVDLRTSLDLAYNKNNSIENLVIVGSINTRQSWTFRQTASSGMSYS